MDMTRFSRSSFIVGKRKTFESDRQNRGALIFGNFGNDKSSERIVSLLRYPYCLENHPGSNLILVGFNNAGYRTNNPSYLKLMDKDGNVKKEFEGIDDIFQMENIFKENKFITLQGFREERRVKIYSCDDEKPLYNSDLCSDPILTGVQCISLLSPDQPNLFVAGNRNKLAIHDFEKQKNIIETDLPIKDLLSAWCACLYPSPSSNNTFLVSTSDYFAIYSVKEGKLVLKQSSKDEEQFLSTRKKFLEVPERNTLLAIKSGFGFSGGRLQMELYDLRNLQKEPFQTVSVGKGDYCTCLERLYSDLGGGGGSNIFINWSIDDDTSCDIVEGSAFSAVFSLADGGCKKIWEDEERGGISHDVLLKTPDVGRDTSVLVKKDLMARTTFLIREEIVESDKKCFHVKLGKGEDVIKCPKFLLHF